MKTAFKVGLSALAAVLFTAPGHALLVNYEFEGIITQSEFDQIDEGSTFRGTLAFNPDLATPSSVEDVPGFFDFPVNLAVELGPYQLAADHTALPGSSINTDSVNLGAMFVEGAPALSNPKLHVAFSGDRFFDEDPVNNLDGGQWENARPGDEDLFVFFDDSPEGGPSASGEFTRFEFVNGSDPVAPIPEPATMVIFGTGLAGAFGAGFRRKKRQ